MFSRDELVLHLLSAFLGRGKDLRQPGTEILLTALHARESRDGRFGIILNDLNIGAELTEQRTHNALRLIQHRTKNMLWLNLLILIALGEFNAGLDRFLPS